MTKSTILLWSGRVLFILACLRGVHANAAPISYGFSGSVTTVDAELSADFSVGDAVSGIFTYEGNTPGLLSGSEGLGYTDYWGAISRFEIAVGRYSASGVLDYNLLQVANNWGSDPTRDVFDVGARLDGPQINGVSPVVMLQLLDDTATSFADTQLTHVVDLTGWAALPGHWGGGYLSFHVGGGAPLVRIQYDAVWRIEEGSHGTAALTFTGADEPFIVPAGVTELTVDMWGAGGEFGSADLGGLDCEYMPGGGGGYVNARVPVTSGEILTVRVGGAPKNLTGAGWPNGGKGWLDEVKAGGRTYVFGVFGGGGGSSSILRGDTVIAEAGGGNGGLPCTAPLGGGWPRSCTPFGNQRGTDLATGYEAGGGGWCGGASSQPSASGVASGVGWSYVPGNGQTAGAAGHVARQGAGEGGFLYSAKPGRVVLSW